jgi:hypothetical protein
MAGVQTVKFKKTVEKLCIDCVVDVDKLLDQCQKSITDRLEKLAKDIVRVPAAGVPPDELEKMPSEIKETLKREGSDFKKVVVVNVEVKVQGSKLSSNTVSMGGPLAEL